jgi:hypothetical protein
MEFKETTIIKLSKEDREVLEKAKIILYTIYSKMTYGDELLANKESREKERVGTTYATVEAIVDSNNNELRIREM